MREDSNQFPIKKKKKIDLWQLVYQRDNKIVEEIIVGNYALCQFRKKEVKFNYPRNMLNIIPKLR